MSDPWHRKGRLNDITGTENTILEGGIGAKVKDINPEGVRHFPPVFQPKLQIFCRASHRIA